MNRFLRVLTELALVLGLAAPSLFGQKPPAPPPPTTNPPTGSPNRPLTPFPSTTAPADPASDFVMFLTGKVATDDGTHLPNNVMIERLCNAKVRQQVYADVAGGFTMQLGSLNDSAMDASADAASQPILPNRFSETGIPRRQLASCEVRASIAGFQSPSISLVDMDSSGKSVEIGTILVHRRTKVEGGTVNAAAYKGAPKDAVAAYEKGIDAERHDKLPNAQKYFEKAVAAYPNYAHAWFQLGVVLQKQNDRAAARTAYTKATAIDDGFLAPHVTLAAMAWEEGKWNEVLRLTNPILALDPFKNMKGYTVELEPFSYADTYFYNAFANYKLNNFNDAERSGLKAEQLMARTPQLHLLLAEIFARKKNYTSAIAELNTYLQLVPNANNAAEVRVRLADFEREKNAPPTEGQRD